MEKRFKEDEEDAEITRARIAKEDNKLTNEIKKLRNNCESSRTEKGEASEPVSCGKEYQLKRREAANERTEAKELDRMSRGCMATGLEALNELRNARTSDHTRGFRSHVLTSSKMKVAA